MIYCYGLQARKRYIKSVFSRSNLPAITDYGHSTQHIPFIGGLKSRKDASVEKKIWPENLNSSLNFFFMQMEFENTLCLCILGTVSRGGLHPYGSN
jgi:hypothetical protein